MIGRPDSQCSYQETRIMPDIGYPLPFQPECNRKPGLTAANDQHIKDPKPNALQHWIADYTTILAKAAANPETSLGRLADN
jgi:hypothetical protein